MTTPDGTPAPDTLAPPDLPHDAPVELQRFVGCRTDCVEVDPRTIHPLSAARVDN